MRVDDLESLTRALRVLAGNESTEPEHILLNTEQARADDGLSVEGRVKRWDDGLLLKDRIKVSCVDAGD